MHALDDLVRAGKIRYIGCSNFSGWHLMKSLAISEKYGLARHVAHQAYYSLVGRDYEWELMPLGLKEGVGALVWSPLGWGRLTGKIRRGQPIPSGSRLQSQAGDVEVGPPVPEERLYKVVDALDEIATADRQVRSADRDQLAAAAARRSRASSSGQEMRNSCDRTSARSAGTSSRNRCSDSTRRARLRRLIPIGTRQDFPSATRRRLKKDHHTGAGSVGLAASRIDSKLAR